MVTAMDQNAAGVAISLSLYRSMLEVGATQLQVVLLLDSRERNERNENPSQDRRLRCI